MRWFIFILLLVGLSCVARILWPMLLRGNIPQNSLLHLPTLQTPRGIILLFHGCQHSGEDWFTLPEERIIVDLALQHHFAVLAFTSLDRISGCWSHEDLLKVQQIWNERASMFTNDIQVFGIGASSGGTFLFNQLSYIPFQAVYIQIAWIPPLNEIALPNQMDFLYMSNREHDLYREFQLKHHNSTTTVKLHQANPCAITVERLTSRIPELGNSIKRIINDLQLHQVIDRNGFPLTSNLHQAIIIAPSLRPALQQQVNVCLAKHELTSEHFLEILQTWI